MRLYNVSMFAFALFVGIYAYLIFALGLAGVLYKDVVVVISISFWTILFLWKTRAREIHIKELLHSFHSLTALLVKQKLATCLVLLLLFQAIVNLIGALGPELAFDSLWYHLTIPKVWLLNHSISFIPGGLLYYSVMPKLGELLFVPGLVFGGAIGAKLIHFSFGILVGVALYRLQRKFFTPLISLVGVVIFYSNLVVGWESITGYIDLIRTFFEVMALWGFLNWQEDKQRKWLILSACMLGLAITTKLLAIGSLIILSILCLWINRKEVTKMIGPLTIYWLIALVIPLPWLLLSYLATGNPVYPFFTELYKVTPEPLTLFGYFLSIWELLIKSSDPLSPIYLLFIPLVIFCWPKLSKEIKVIGLYSSLALIGWYFTPRTGGGRFILPYLPAFSILCAACLKYFFDNKKKYGRLFTKILLTIVIFISMSSIGYRLAANVKYLPVILGQQTQQSFLTDHLNFSFGDFYDTDNYFKEHIGSNDKVLLYGFHNLYYVDFPFVDSSWVSDKDKFTYIATQNTKLPEKYKQWKLVYKNDKTMVNLYQKPAR